MTTLTLDEQERRAYADGDVERAALLRTAALQAPWGHPPFDLHKTQLLLPLTKKPRHALPEGD